MSMVHCMVGGGGGIKDAFAVIVVTYPAGSHCDCTNGTKTLTAKDTSGEYMFLIPESGSWTVSCTDGIDTAFKSVVISTQYQAENVVLSYWNGELYDAGNEYTNVTGGWIATNESWETPAYEGTFMPTLEKTSTHLKISNKQNDKKGSLRTVNKVDITGFSSLHIDCIPSTIWGGNQNGLLLKSTPEERGNAITKFGGNGSTRKTVSLDISSYTGEYYIVIGLISINNSGDVESYFKIWME